VRERALGAEEVPAQIQTDQGVEVGRAGGAMVESEDVLAEALSSGRLSAVALDVHPSEPPRVAHRLYRDPRVISTPHSVGLTQRWNEDVFNCLADGVTRVLAGDHPPNLLNPEALAMAGARRLPGRARGIPHNR